MILGDQQNRLAQNAGVSQNRFLLILGAFMKLFKNVDMGLFIMRLSLGVLMLFHGVSKLTHGVSFIEGTLVNQGLPAFFAYGVYIGEIVAPLAIVLGYKTRLFSLIFAFNCLVAIYLVHSADFLKLNPHGGWAIELLALYFFGALSLVFAGGGKFGLRSKGILD